MLPSSPKYTRLDVVLAAHGDAACPQLKTDHMQGLHANAIIQGYNRRAHGQMPRAELLLRFLEVMPVVFWESGQAPSAALAASPMPRTAATADVPSTINHPFLE